MLNGRHLSRTGDKQRGAAAVEFGIVAIAFLLLFLGIVEFGRVFYLYNTVQEVTRCAAREAVVKWTSEEEKIARRCIFHDEDSAGSLVLGWEVRDIDVQLRYLNGAGGVASPSSPENNIAECQSNSDDCIRFVEASLRCDSGSNCDTATHRVVYQPLFGLIPVQGVQIPGSTVTMPAESMGFRLD